MPSIAGTQSSTAAPSSTEAVPSDADVDRILERARAALSERWEKWCLQRAMPALDALWTHYAPMNLEQVERDLVSSLRTLDEMGCAETSAAARTWMYLGLVRAGKDRHRPGAERAFREALRIDATTALDEPLADDVTRSTWARLQKELGVVPRARAHVPVREDASLLQALRKIGACASCSVARRARAWVLLGTWQTLRGEAAALDSFREALSLEPATELDARVSPPAAREAMRAARASRPYD